MTALAHRPERAFVAGIDREFLPGLRGGRTSAFVIGEPPSNVGPLHRRDEPRVVFQPGDKPFNWDHDSDWWRPL